MRDRGFEEPIAITPSLVRASLCADFGAAAWIKPPVPGTCLAK